MRKHTDAITDKNDRNVLYLASRKYVLYVQLIFEKMTGEFPYTFSFSSFMTFLTHQMCPHGTAQGFAITDLHVMFLPLEPVPHTERLGPQGCWVPESDQLPLLTVKLVHVTVVH